MSYSLLSLSQKTRRQAVSGLREAAAREQERKQTHQALKSAERQESRSAIGMGASVGAMVSGGIGAVVGAGVGYVLGELF